MTFSTPLDSSTGSGDWQRDLAWVACQAATELDGLLLGRTIEIHAVTDLTSALSASVVRDASGATPVGLVDPTTTVVLTRALVDAGFNQKGKKLSDLIRQTAHLVEQLHQVALRSRPTDPQTLKELRTFCLAVARHAAAETPQHGRPEHPFRG